MVDLKHQIVGLAVLLVNACSGVHTLPQNGATDVANVPADFSIWYECREGSVPPPYYSEYRLTVVGTGAAELVFRPDYDFNNPPTWSTMFTVPTEARADLYGLLERRGVFARLWPSSGQPVIGSRTRTAEFLAQGRRTTIPANPSSDDAALAEEVFSAVEGLVSEEIWQHLRQQQEAYQAGYSEKK